MIFGSDWSFVQNPHAASSSVTAALAPYIERGASCGRTDEPMRKHEIPRAGAVPLKRHRLGVVRNPYDRLVSVWSFCREHTHPGVSFRNFVLHDEWKIGPSSRAIDVLRTPQMAWLVGCNKVLRFENLNDEFARWSEAQLGRRLDLPRLNRSARSGGFSAYYLTDDGTGFDTELIDAVRSRFWFDFEVWRYGFK